MADWRVTSVIGAIAVVGFVGLSAWLDRQAVLETVRSSTLSNARMIAAHGEVSIGEAAQAAAAAAPYIAAWDLEAPAEGRRIHTLLKTLVDESPRIASIWVIDTEGRNRLDTWGYPARAINSSERPYFRRHLSGEPSPVIVGSETGGNMGLRRFTYSVAVPSGDGALHAIVVVGIFTSGFDILYAQAAGWRDARAGLYTERGEILAELGHGDGGLRDILNEVAGYADTTSGGTRIGEFLGEHRVLAWQVSSEYPNVFAASSQPIGVGLSHWRSRTALLFVVGASVTVLLALLTRSTERARWERERTMRAEIASREVHHRMKNSLQMISSVARLRARSATRPEVREALDELSAQLRALAEVQNLLQVGEVGGVVDLGSVIEKLCDRIGTSHARRIDYAGDGSVPTDSGDAARIAILANELIANALKHGGGRVSVTLGKSAGGAELVVANEGAPLPDDFDLLAQTGFGLKTVHSVADGLGATITPVARGRLGGAEFRVSLPTAPGNREEEAA